MVALVPVGCKPFAAGGARVSIFFAEAISRSRRLFQIAHLMLAMIALTAMTTLTIRQLDEKTKSRLRVQAAHHGRSMEQEAREILRSALTAARPKTRNLPESIRQRFSAFGGVELELPKRDPIRHPPDFAA